EAVPGVKMRVGNNSVEYRNVEEIAHNYHLRLKRIGECRVRIQIGTVRKIVLGGIYKLAEDGKACACSADGNSASNCSIQRPLRTRAAPEIDVVSLISTGDKNRGSVTDSLRDEGVLRSVAAGNNQSSD